MRTPDEIKKGLEMAAIDCRDAHDCEKTCAYHKACIGFYHDMTSIPCVMVEDALALIQQKEQDNAELSENIKWMEAERDDLKRLIQQLEAERDALMVFVKGQCHACKFSDCSFTEDPCDSCFADRRSKWEWRGVQKEE